MHSARFGVGFAWLTIVAAGIVVVLPEAGNWQRWVVAGEMIALVLAVAQWSNAYSLVRERAIWLFLVFPFAFVALPYAHTAVLDTPAALLLVGGNVLLFTCYQRPQGSQGQVFYAFLLLGMATLYAPAFLALTPLLLLALGTYLQGLSLRNFLSACLGLLVPYAMGATVYFCLKPNGSFEELYTYMYNNLMSEWPPAVPDLRYVLLAALVAVALADFLFTGWRDKVKTRLLLRTMAWQVVFLFVLALFRPTDGGVALVAAFALATPLLGRHLTLLRGKAAPYWRTIFFATFVIAYFL